MFRHFFRFSCEIFQEFRKILTLLSNLSLTLADVVAILLLTVPEEIVLFWLPVVEVARGGGILHRSSCTVTCT